VHRFVDVLILTMSMNVMMMHYYYWDFVMIQILFLIFLNVVRFFHIQIDHDDHQMDPKKEKTI